MEDKILNALDFSKIPNNEEFKADRQNCAWILPDGQNKSPNSAPYMFWTWLISDEPLLWISGKAGCGKSTLMQYLYREERENGQFSKWVKDNTLTVAAFFFFERGGDLQKSRQGMLRSLLHQIFSTDRTLLKKMFAKEFEVRSSLPPSFLDWGFLRTTFEKVLQEYIANKKKIILFIDGLDEYRDLEHSNKYSEKDFDLIYDGPNEDARWGISTWISAGHEEIAGILQGFEKGGSVKIIVSSRELPTFEKAFGNAKRVKVHEHTESAIREYCERRLRAETSNMIDVTKFVDEIASMSSGVFLWVRLVVDTLVQGNFEGDTELELLELLRSLPDRLCGKHGLYSTMLGRIKREHLREASRIFRLVSEACTPLHTFQLFFATEGHLSPKGELLAVGGPIGPYDRPLRELESELEAKQRRLRSRCAGLLEVSTIHNVQYMHQTAKEFMSRDGVLNSVFQSDVDKDIFDPNLALLSGYIRFLKLDPWQIWNYIPCLSSCTPGNLHRWEQKPGEQMIIAVSHVHVADDRGQDRASYVLLVDELDRVCGSICESLSVLEYIKPAWDLSTKNSLSSYSSVQPRRWYHFCDSNSGNWPPGVDCFQSYAAWRGLATYLDEKLQAQDIACRKSSAESLLSSVATTWEDNKRLITPLEIPQPRVLEVLFRHGASPNTKTQRRGFNHEPSGGKKMVSSTIWADILESGFAHSITEGVRGFRFKGELPEWRNEVAQQQHSLRHKSPDDSYGIEQLELAWTGSIVQFLRHGADTNVQIEIGVWSNDTDCRFRSDIMTPIEMIRACISGMPRLANTLREIEDLLRPTKGCHEPMDVPKQLACSSSSLGKASLRYSADLVALQVARNSSSLCINQVNLTDKNCDSYNEGKTWISQNEQFVTFRFYNEN